MPLSPGPWVKPQYFDDDGNPATAFRLFFYDAGTSTKRDTYQDADQSSLNTNPVVLDAAGRANIFLLPTLYKIVYAEPGSDDPPSSPIWTVDDVGPSGGIDTNVDVTGTAGENIALNEVAYLSDGSGALTAGRWYLADADQTYSSNGAVMLGIATAEITSGDTGTFRRNGRMTGLSGLTAGTTYYVSATAGAMTSTPPTNGIVVGKADSTTSLVMDPQWGFANATVNGLVSTTTQTLAGVKTFNSQPQTLIGTATTLPATVAGVFYTDVASHTPAANSTNVVMSATTIPANMLNANGKGVLVRAGSSTGSAGANAVTINLQVGGGISATIISAGVGFDRWLTEAYIVRIDSDSVDVSVSTRYAVATIQSYCVRIDSLDFTAALALETQATTGAATTVNQSYFTVEAIG